MRTFQPSHYSEQNYGQSWIGPIPFIPGMLAEATKSAASSAYSYFSSDSSPAEAPVAPAPPPPVVPQFTPMSLPPPPAGPQPKPPADGDDQKEEGLLQTTWFVPTLILAGAGVIAGGIWYFGRK